MREVIVFCRSEDSYPQKPVALIWDGVRLEVETIFSRSRMPDGMQFKVKATGDRSFKLYYQEENDRWLGQEE
jgi:hypothetical protein